MLWTIVAILLVLWMTGWSMHVPGIHLLLGLVAVIFLVWKLATASTPAS